MKLGFNETENDENQVVADHLNISHDLTFLDFGSMASEPVGSKQREHRSVISARHWLFSIIECSFP